MPRQGFDPAAIVVGTGPREARAALDLAQAGVRVTLVTAEDGLAPGDDGPLATPILLQTVRHPRVRLLTGATVKDLASRSNADPHDGIPGLRATLHQLPRYVDPDRCTACGACSEICPVQIPERTNSAIGCGTRAIYRVGMPTSYAIDKAGTAPCRHACPIDQRAQGYIALVGAGNFEGAYRVIKRENPFPSVCGRVCNHRCEDVCTRNDIDEPVAVMALKRFVADWAVDAGIKSVPEIAARSGYRVAVVGAGPAGLTAARDLNALGHGVVVFEALPVAGGMMRVGIPAFRLPRERLEWEVDEILDSGVELRTNSRVDDVNALFYQGFDAVVLAVGLHVSRSLAIPGIGDEKTDPQANPSIVGAIEFLRRINLGDRPDWRGRKVVVVGGGSTAMDAARVTRRLGADVQIVYRRSRAEMPAHDSEIQDAEREGVQIQFLTNPERFVRKDGRLVGMECVRMELGEPDESGRRRPVPVPDSHFVLPVDSVLLAIGQTSDLPDLGGDDGVAVSAGIVAHDAETLMAARPGLFVAGDVAGTAGYVVDAMASGARAARSVDRYLRGENGVPEPECQPEVQLDEVEVAWRLREAAPQGTPRIRNRSLLAENLWRDFNETEIGLTESQAKDEAARCLSCGLCSECLACVQACPAGAINPDCTDKFINLETDVCVFGDGSDEAAVWACDAGYGGVFDGRNGVDLSDTVSQVLDLLNIPQAPVLPAIAAPARHSLGFSVDNREPRIGVFLCRCGGEIERAVDLSGVGARVTRVPGTVMVKTIDFACHPEGAEIIRADIAGNALDGAVLAACSCCGLDQICYSCTTQRTRSKEQLGVWSTTQNIPVKFVNVREQCAFVHAHRPAAATSKAADMITACAADLTLSSRVDRALIGPGSEFPSRIPITATIDPVRCRGCDDCEVACGLDAMHILGDNGARFAKVDPLLCLGCGVCMAACSSGAISAGDTSDVRVDAMLRTMGVSDKTVVFSCNWGAYSAVEAAGIERLEYSPSVRVIRVMCAGRLHEGLLLKAFSYGAERVLLLACGHDETQSLCYYHTGADQSRDMVDRTHRLMRLLGIEPARLGWAEIRPGDGSGFVSLVREFAAASSSRIAQGQS